MINRTHAATLVAALLSASAAIPPLQASGTPPVTITTYATLAPNFFGSPSFPTWAANGIYAAENGLTTFGSAGPTQFNVASTSPLPVADSFVTGYPSWLGVADPTGADASELGTRPSFVGIINGNGGLITIDDMGFFADSSDPGDNLGVDFPSNAADPSDPDPWTYDAYDIGIINLPGGGFTVVDSGPSSQQVNEIITIGAGNGYASYDGAGSDDPNPSATDQQILDYDIAQAPAAFDFTGTFTYGSSSGSATFVFGTVPETINSGLLFGLTLIALALFAPRLRSRPA